MQEVLGTNNAEKIFMTDEDQENGEVVVKLRFPTVTCCDAGGDLIV